MKWNRDKFYGFIGPDTGAAGIFFHGTTAADPDGLFEGATVQFDVRMTDRGPAAYNVRMVE